MVNYPTLKTAIKQLLKFYPTRTDTAKALRWPKSTFCAIASGSRPDTSWKKYIQILQLIEKNERLSKN